MKLNITKNDIKIGQIKELRNSFNFQQLLYFIATAQELSISKAARLLGVGQPGLSQQLQKLEEGLGQPLFVKSRGRSGIRLTAFGEGVLQQAERIKDSSMEFLNIVKGESKVLQQYRIGASPSTPKVLLENAAKIIIPDPMRRMSLIQAESQTLSHYLEMEQIDYLISDELPHTSNKRIDKKLIFSSEIFACAHKKLIDSSLSEKELFESAPLIYPGPTSRLTQSLDQYFQTNSITPNIHAEIQDTALQVSLASQAEGIVFLSTSSSKEFLAKSPKNHVKLFSLKDVILNIYLCNLKHTSSEYIQSLFEL